MAQRPLLRRSKYNELMYLFNGDPSYGKQYKTYTHRLLPPDGLTDGFEDISFSRNNGTFWLDTPVEFVDDELVPEQGYQPILPIQVSDTRSIIGLRTLWQLDKPYFCYIIDDLRLGYLELKTESKPNLIGKYWQCSYYISKELLTETNLRQRDVFDHSFGRILHEMNQGV